MLLNPYYQDDTTTEGGEFVGYGEVSPEILMKISYVYFDGYSPSNDTMVSIREQVACVALQLALTIMEEILNEYNFSFSEYGFVME